MVARRKSVPIMDLDRAGAWLSSCDRLSCTRTCVVHETCRLNRSISTLGNLINLLLYLPWLQFVRSKHRCWQLVTLRLQGCLPSGDKIPTGERGHGLSE